MKKECYGGKINGKINPQSCIFLIREITEGQDGKEIRNIGNPACVLKTKGHERDYIEKMMKEREGKGWKIPENCETYLKWEKEK